MTFAVQSKKSLVVSYAVFALSLGAVLIFNISLFFPALIHTWISPAESSIDPFEPGIWAIPVLISNLVLLYFVIAYYQNKIPKLVLKSIGKIFGIQISQKLTYIIIGIILAIFILINAEEIQVYELEVWTDYARVEKQLNQYPFDLNNTGSYLTFVKISILKFSEIVLQNVRIMPFVITILLALTVYLFTKDITKNRFAGIISMTILLQTDTFLRYDTTATYSNDWILFYLLSLFVIRKKLWYTSPVIFLVAFFAKPFSILFLPMVFFFILREDMAKKKKVLLSGAYSVISAIVLIAAYFFRPSMFENFSYDAIRFWEGFTIWHYSLREDTLVLLFLIPLIIGLFVVSLRGLKTADSISFLILGIMMTSPILLAITTFNVQPYRFVPLLVFFSIGFGVVLSHIGQKVSDDYKKSLIV